MAYDDGTFYDAMDSEQLTHYSPDEAIEELLQSGCWQGTCRECISEASHIEVTAYKPKDIPAAEFAADSVSAIQEHIAELLMCDHDNPDGDAFEFDSNEAYQLKLWFTRVFEARTSWQCDEVGKRVYTEAEILGMFSPEELDND